MRAILAAVFSFALASGLQAQGSEPPVVVELYTSQGCSSCPPADALMAELAPREDVIALALHVDYWDYIGWTDNYGSPAFTRRQKGYASAAGARTIYTPQFVVGGRDHVVGYKPMQLAEMIADDAARDKPVSLSLSRNGNRLKIRAESREPGKMLVQLARYQPHASVAIERGENAGKTIDYFNIVTALEVVSDWNGRAPLDLSVTVRGSEPVVVLIQKDGHGPVLAAARLR
ncbi:MAG: DUF1223 domain-containing protein [Rhodobacteraceae bacterium]|nr:DUF1223 domain-containing protein [Paracoccaceae bacterium]